ncbi:MAG TPA: GNAT family N-acetyltransferase [Xanthomonadaceae bacterium]|nr:GNAT family N-acetyltransferase [Xanthomonadaceae bacterium]
MPTRAIVYRTDRPRTADYHALFQATGWNEHYRAEAAELDAALDRSWLVVSAYLGQSMVGIGRVVSDGVLYAMVYDLIVHPRHRGRGIGGELLRRMMATCEIAHIREVQLFCASGLRDWYRGFGFVERPADAPGMRLQRQPPPSAST